MWKALFKKQFLELSTFYFQNKKTGKNRGRLGTAAFVLLFVFVFACMALMFAGTGFLLSPLIEAGLDWLYFAMLGMIALLLGVFGSVFNTYAGLYHAKDNALLLSMPIPPSYILTTRLVGVYAMGLLFEALVLVPVIVVYWLVAPAFSVTALVLQILLIPILGLLVLALTCALGWVVALISGRLKNKSFVTVILSLAFIAVYYAVCFRLNTLLAALVANADAVSSAVRGWVWPAYAFGSGAAGNVGHFLGFAAIAAALCALCIYVMARSFLRIVTSERGAKKAVYTERAARASGVDRALLRKELGRFKASPTYMLNCGLGLLLLPAAAVFLLLKAGDVRAALAMLTPMLPPGMDVLPVLAAVALTMLSAMVCITAPSVSLEGNSLWLVQSLPVAPWDALRAKLRLQLVLAALPTVFTAAALCIVLQLGAVSAVCVLLLSLLVMLFSAVLGLSVNLKKPNLSWTNETAPVKQSLAVFIALFGLWVLAVVIGGGYYLTYRVLAAPSYLLLWCALLLAVNALLLRWLKTRGSAIFARL